jgi:aminoglycoside phosphotransferase (APT) family kinase protein
MPLPTSPASIVHPLSEVAQGLLGLRADDIRSTPIAELTKALANLIQKSDLIWQSSSTKSRYVARCNHQLVLKSIGSSSDFTEYTTLQYLQRQRPQIQVPQPHGLVISGKSAYLLMSYIPGVTLADAWPLLQESEKESISKKLDTIFSDLRQLQRPAEFPLGGVAGEGCKDTRRNTRISKTPLHTSAELWDFQYSDAPVGSKTYLEFLRRLTSPLIARECVFTHGDLRPANIMVQPDADGSYQVTGIIDWEMSGYPRVFHRQGFQRDGFRILHGISRSCDTR